MPPSTSNPFAHVLGRFVDFEIRRFGNAGAFLAEADSDSSAPTVLLLGHEIPEGAREGDAISAFVYLDSEGRPLATTTEPKLTLGEVAFLPVSAITSFGAFVDWDLPKELLVPLALQTADMHVGSRYAVGLTLDDRGRLSGTMRVAELLQKPDDSFEQDEWVEGEAWRWDSQIGLFVIVERRYVGLVPAQEPHGLSRGEAARFRITNILPDGKMELSLRALAHEQLADDSEHVLARLRRPDAPPVGDRSDPEQIRTLFGLSKKAFKRALGRLLKDGAIDITPEGYARPRPAAPTPPKPAPTKRTK